MGMPSVLEEVLQGQRRTDRAGLEMLYRKIESNDEVWVELASLLKSKNDNVQGGAAFLLRRHLEDGAKVDAEVLQGVIENLDLLSGWDAKFISCRILALAANRLSRKQKPQAVRFLEGLRNSDRLALRVFAMDAYMRLSQGAPELEDTRKGWLDEARAEGAPAFISRLRNLEREGIILR